MARTGILLHPEGQPSDVTGGYVAIFEEEVPLLTNNSITIGDGEDPLRA